MCYKRTIETPTQHIDFDAIRMQKKAMIRQLLQAKKKAEQAGEIVSKPFKMGD
ncbi:hypothetical protein J3D56_003614 [Erwinia persicina]|jgi:hypothetical protein|uniref:Uncharacterized protein n=2 Tax=Erwinia TaxID=551 RepID=A0ABV4E8Y4_9GAMM|nr:MULTISPECIES: hypothetical protein [Erwinia]MCP1440178.1 hypothetical protein [Erwinia persicina]MDN8543239.1 hypothetical protein [Erwinia sp. BC051422]